MTGDTSLKIEGTFARRDSVLQAYYDRLNQIDESNRDLTSFFFAINAVILAVVFEFSSPGWSRVILAFVGYTAAVALMLIGYKSFWSWKAYAKDVRQLEDELGYDLSRRYEKQLKANGSAQITRVTLVRLRFNFLFVLLFLLVIIYLVFTIPSTLPLIIPLLRLLLGVIMVIITAFMPWIYLTGAVHFGAWWAVLRAPWTRDV